MYSAFYECMSNGSQVFIGSAPIPYVGRIRQGIKLSGCFRKGEFVLLCFRVKFELFRQITPICPEM